MPAWMRPALTVTGWGARSRTGVSTTIGMRRLAARFSYADRAG
jgi:hypothetical protein